MLQDWGNAVMNIEESQACPTLAGSNESSSLDTNAIGRLLVLAGDTWGWKW